MRRIPIDRPAFNAAVTAMVGLGLVAYALTVFPAFNHNDFMYAVAPSLLGDYSLYEDLPFVQAPGSIWLFALLYKVTDPANAYLTFRVVSLICLILAGFFLYRTAAVLAGPIAALLVPILLFGSQFVASIAEEIGSTPLALLFLSAGVFVFFTKPAGPVSSALLGLTIGLAASAKLNFALYAIPFGVFLAVDRGLFSREVLAFVLSGIFGSALVWVYFLSGPGNFWFFNIDFHYLTNLARGQTAADGAIAVGVMLAMFAFKSLPQLILCGLATSRLRSSPKRRQFGQLGVLFGISLIAALSPLYVAVQYLAASAFMLCLLSCMAAGILSSRYAQSTGKFWGLVFGVALLSMALFGFQRVSSSIPAYADNTAGPTVIRGMRDRVEELGNAYLDDAKCLRTALSLSPIPLVGTSFSILPQSATGPFIPRIASQIERHAPAFAGLADMQEILDRKRPTAFVVGYYPQYGAERAILRYAQNNKYRAFDLGALANDLENRIPRTLFLLLRSDCLAGTDTLAPDAARNLNASAIWSAQTIYGPGWEQSASATGRDAR